jgi:hypothetical protein
MLKCSAAILNALKSTNFTALVLLGATKNLKKTITETIKV